MSELVLQADQSQAIQDFYDLIARESVPTPDLSGAPTSHGLDHFIPIGRLEIPFQENSWRRTRLLLKAVFPPGDLPVRPQDVAEQCCRVFSILILIGRGAFIPSFLRNPNLWDERLPFVEDTPPSHFPTDSNGPDFYKRFCQEQWKFCAPIMRKRMGVHFDQRYPLPFRNLNQKGGGHTAVVYRAEIHEKHDDLSPHTTPSHVYAIKTYKRRSSQQNYEKESEAFRKITESGSRQTPGIIGFYAGFEYRGTFNLLLEYADRGTLQDFFKREKPSGGSNIIDFWNTMFELIKGVFWIHDHHLPVGAPEDGRLQQGWHQDLKPTNILVLSSDGAATYQGFTFKIADFGLSHFKTIMEGHGDSIGLDARGTRTYGAPETYSHSSFAENRKHNWIKRAVDIWSLGCIFSEAATWVVEGCQGIVRYERDRITATGRLQNFRGGDCFHNGQKRLTFVDSHHLKLRQDLQYDDHLTGRVLENMVEEMLLEKSETRPTAEQLDTKAKAALQLARAGLQRQSTLLNEQYSQTSPPRLPPGPPLETFPTRSRRGSNARGQIFSGEIVNSPSNTISFLNQTGPYQQQSPPVTPTNETQWQAPPPDFPYTKLPTKYGTTSAPHYRKQSHHDSVHRASDPLPPTLLQGKDGQDSHQVLHHSPPRMQPPLLRCQDCGYYIPHDAFEEHKPRCDGGLLKNQQSLESAASTQITVTTSSARSAPRQEVPTCSVAQADAWYRAVKEVKREHRISSLFQKTMKDEDKSPKLPHHDLLEHLGERDHVFMIDDSNTMNKHWKDVRYLAMLLTYIVKETDKDGVDVVFLSSSKSYNCTNSTQVWDLIGNHKTKTVTSLDDHFNDDFGKYGRALTSRFTSPKKRSIYVLTDGVLDYGEKTQGQDAVRTVVSSLRQAKMNKGQLGIQLISFGNDKAGLDLLEAFDVFKPQGLDIVDTEPSTGNVWKMLLGSINSRFDNDPETHITPTSSA